MKVIDFDQQPILVRSIDDVRRVFAKRHDGSNGFYCAGEGSRYPLLVVLVRDERAVVSWHPDEEHPGFFADSGLSDSLEFEFYLVKDGGSPTEFSGSQVVEPATAQRAMEEFFVGAGIRPPSIAWLEL